MRFGINIPSVGQGLSRELVLQVAQAGERRGFDACWVGDHLVLPVNFTSKYPYSEDGSFPLSGDVPFLEAVATLCVIAGATERIKLGTSIMIIGLRPPLQNAKAWTTLDVLSKGRAIMGVGLGWLREEFEAVGMPFDNRGARASEQLEMFAALEREVTPSYRGKYYQLDPVYYAPRPFNGHIPVWIGGHVEAALRRVAKYGDSFLSFAATPAILRQEKEVLERECNKIGRDPATIGLALCGQTVIFDPKRFAANPFSASLGPSVARMTDQIGEFDEIGVDHMVILAPWLPPFSMDEVVPTYERFAAEVMQKFS